jgi:hypothetical protein
VGTRAVGGRLGPAGVPFADETQSAHSQVIARVVSTNGRIWSGKTNTVAPSPATLRPGMPVVRRLPNGSYYMVYELCPVKSPYGCGVYSRTSTDGWDWGPADSVGNRIQTPDGRFLAHTPTIAWAPGGRGRGRLLLVGQLFEHADGSIAAGNGATILVNTHNGRGRWSVATAPVAIADAFDDPGACTNYSSTLVPLGHGRRVLEIATDYAPDGICKPYIATGPIARTRRHHAAVRRRSRCRPSPQPSGGSHESWTRRRPR